MSSEQVSNNMKWLMLEEKVREYSVSASDEGVPIVTIDLHGLNCKYAHKVLQNVVNINRGEFVLSLIHGFNHGTVLKKMILEESWGGRVIDKKSNSWNPGQTYLRLAA